MEFSFENHTKSAFRFRIEPWGDEFSLPVGSRIEVVPKEVDALKLNLSCHLESENLLILWCEGGALDLRVLIDGKRVRE